MLLIGIMYAGESQYDAAKASLAMQNMRDYDVFYIENMPNLPAHETTYRRFMSEAANYKYFLKFDADFVLRDPEVLTRVLAMFDRPEIGCVTLDVKDWLSGLSISGMHIFSNQTRWVFSESGLFVDGGEQISGETVRVQGLDWISHNPEPEPYQAFRFGIHRASKSLQPDRALATRDMVQGVKQHVLLQAIARKYLQGDDHPSRLWAMLGVELMYQANDRRIMDYAGDYVRAAFANLAKQPIESYAPPIIETWTHEIDAVDRWIKTFMNPRVI